MKTLPTLLLAALAGPVTLPAMAGEGITGAFNERPPYLHLRDDGTPGGLTGTPAVQAFRSAHITVHWTVLPTNRQIALIRENASPTCAIGWFITPERQQYAKFTKAIYRDQPWMVLASSAFDASEHETLETVLSRRSTRVLVKDKYSYGNEIDGMLQRLKPTIAVSTGTTVQMLQSLGAHTVDMMFVSEEEGRFLLASGGPQVRNLKLLRFAGMPKGETRHIMCSKNVPDELIGKLNKAITFK